MASDTPNRFPINFPGFLRSAEGGYIKHEDFLTFVAGASTSKTGDVKDRAMAWLRRQGVTGPIDQLSPADCQSAHRVGAEDHLGQNGKGAARNLAARRGSAVSGFSDGSFSD